jgi:hypothetical protein
MTWLACGSVENDVEVLPRPLRCVSADGAGTPVGMTRLDPYIAELSHLRWLFWGVFGELGWRVIVVAETVFLAAEGAVDGGFGII